MAPLHMWVTWDMHMNATYLHPMVYILKVRKQNENGEAQGRYEQKWEYIWRNTKNYF